MYCMSIFPIDFLFIIIIVVYFVKNWWCFVASADKNQLKKTLLQPLDPPQVPSDRAANLSMFGRHS